MKIQLLYFIGCPSWEVALKNLKTAIQQEGIDGDIQLIHVQDDSEAEKYRFLGSPSIHIDGHDLWPSNRDRYFLSCRVYETPEGRKGFPTVEMILEKLRTVPPE